MFAGVNVSFDLINLLYLYATICTGMFKISGTCIYSVTGMCVLFDTFRNGYNSVNFPLQIIYYTHKLVSWKTLFGDSSSWQNAKIGGTTFTTT